MRYIAVLLLLSLSQFSHSQKLKDRLQGNWVCTEILDSLGNKATGKFGASDEYLKFSFVKGNLNFTEAPFDVGLDMPVTFGNDYIDLFPMAVYEVPEKIYTVKSLDKDNLVLATKNEERQTIYYHFLNQASLMNDLKEGNPVIDNGIILIKHLKSQGSNGINRVGEYIIGNKKENLFPGPCFKDQATAYFSFWFAQRFEFPKTYPMETVSPEMILDFDVNAEGIDNVKVVQGINDEIDASVIKIINSSGKKWKPLKVDDQVINSTLRFHFIFYLGKDETMNTAKKMFN
jgi:hypothetical protein